MKERAKLQKAPAKRNEHHISMRLSAQVPHLEEAKNEDGRQDKRKNLGGGTFSVVEPKGKDSKMEVTK